VTAQVNKRFVRANRLTESAQYQDVFSGNFRLSDKYWTVLVGKKQSAQGARLGLAIAKKRISHSVDRNRLKRIIRESFRLTRTELGDVDLVIMAKSECVKTDNRTLHASLRRLWKKLKSRNET
jgi:ribonuclease P protein component